MRLCGIQHTGPDMTFILHQIIFLFNKCTTGHKTYRLPKLHDRSHRYKTFVQLSNTRHHTGFLCHFNSRVWLHPRWRVGMHQNYSSNNNLYAWSPLTNSVKHFFFYINGDYSTNQKKMKKGRGFIFMIKKKAATFCFHLLPCNIKNRSH